MGATIGIGRERQVRYCGINFIVRPSDTFHYGQKAVWEVVADGVVVSVHANTLSKAVRAIHEQAVARGAYPACVNDGVAYGRLVTAVCKK